MVRHQAIEREIEALDNRELFQSHTQTIDEHSTETVVGVKAIEVLVALRLRLGGSDSFASLDDLLQATGGDLNLGVGQKLNSAIGGDFAERIQGIRRAW